MIELIRSDVFDWWLSDLRDRSGRSRILVRLDRLAAGNPGDVKPIGDGISELQVDHGPGYRIYFLQRGRLAIILLCGGDKSTQARDIVEAKRIAKSWKEQDS